MVSLVARCNVVRYGLLQWDGVVGGCATKNGGDENIVGACSLILPFFLADVVARLALDRLGGWNALERPIGLANTKPNLLTLLTKRPVAIVWFSRWGMICIFMYFLRYV